MPRVTVAPMPAPEKLRIEMFPTVEVEQVGDWKNKDVKPDEEDLSVVLKPFLWSSRLFGMYYLDGPQGTWTAKATFFFGYSALVHIIAVAHVSRMFLIVPTMQSLDILIAQGTPMIWSLYVSVAGLIMFSFCAKKTGWKELFFKYHEMHQSCCAPKVENFKRKCYVYVSVAWLVYIGNMLVSVYFLFWTNSMDILALPFQPNDTGIIYMKIASSVAHALVSGMWVLSSAHSVILSDLIGTHFKIYNDNLSRISKQCPVRFSDIFPKVKEMHQSLCGLVETADNQVAPLMALHVLANLVLTSCVLYVLLYNPFQLTSFIFYIGCGFWLVFCAASMFITSGYAAWLHEQAHDAFEVLQDIRVRHVTDDLIIQMTLFVTKMTGSFIGFTAGKMFIIDKNAILTFTGMLITYFFLLIQFRPSSTTPVCDCTSWLANLTLQCTAPV